MVTVVSTIPDPSMVRRTSCGNCGSVLEYVRRDIKNYTLYDYLGDGDTVYYIDCPVCNHQHLVKRW